MLTNDQAADLVKTLLVKAKKGVGKKGGCWSGRGLDSLAFLTLFYPLVFREQGPQPPHHHTPPPTPFPRSAPVTAFRVEQTCCRRIGDRELSGRGVVFINFYSAAPRAGRSFVSGPPPPPLPRLGGEPQRAARPPRPREDTPLSKAGTCGCRPARRGGRRPGFPPPAAEPEAGGAAAGRPAGGARRPASLRGGGGGPAAGTAGPPARGCAPALPDWLAARTRPPELARPPALRRPRRAGGARGGGDAARDELIAGGRAWWWRGAETRRRLAPRRPRGADLSPRRRPGPGDWRSCTYASRARSGLQLRRVPCAPPRARGALARPSSPRAAPRAHHAPLLPLVSAALGPFTSWRWGTRGTRSTRTAGRRGSSAPTWGEARWSPGTRAACC